MKLQDLLSKCARGPFSHDGTLLVDGTDCGLFQPVDNSHVADLNIFEEAERLENTAIYLAHAGNVLPALLENMKGMQDEECCTCGAYSWYGEGHCTDCICSWAEDMVNMIENIPD